MCVSDTVLGRGGQCVYMVCPVCVCGAQFQGVGAGEAVCVCVCVLCVWSMCYVLVGVSVCDLVCMYIATLERRLFGTHVLSICLPSCFQFAILS